MKRGVVAPLLDWAKTLWARRPARRNSRGHGGELGGAELRNGNAGAIPALELARVQEASARVAQQTDTTILEESRRLGPLVAEILRIAGHRAVSGATTRDVADVLMEECRRRGLEPAMLGYNGFPAPAAVSVNDELVHGIPSPRVLCAADLVKIELGVVSGTAFGAQSWTFPVDRTTASDELLLATGRSALRAAVAVVSPAHRVGDVGAAIQSVVEGAGLSVVRSFVGYGMGRSRIQPPQISGVGKPGEGPRLRPGWVLNIHVIIKHGTHGVRIADNRWTALAEDGRRGALFTSMVEVTPEGHVELTRGIEP